MLKDDRPHEGYFPREFIPYKKEAAWASFQSKFEADPELKAAAERDRKYFANRS